MYRYYEIPQTNLWFIADWLDGKDIASRYQNYIVSCLQKLGIKICLNFEVNSLKTFYMQINAKNLDCTDF